MLQAVRLSVCVGRTEVQLRIVRYQEWVANGCVGQAAPECTRSAVSAWILCTRCAPIVLSWQHTLSVVVAVAASVHSGSAVTIALRLDQ